MDRSLVAKRGTTCEPEPERAQRDLAQQVGGDGLAGVLLFCSPRYDLEALPNPEAIIGCDCVLRRLELEAHGVGSQLGNFFASRGVTGFSTCGEQFNAMHLNQTFAGVALGSR